MLSAQSYLSIYICLMLRAGNQDRPPEISYAWCVNYCDTCLEQTRSFSSKDKFASIAEFDEKVLLEAAIVNIQG